MQNRAFYSFNDYLKNKFNTRVHKLSLNAGFGCPNKDGAKGSEGCIFCNEEGFSRFGGKDIPLEEQIKSSMGSARDKFKAGKFIAYFQNGANTYADVKSLKKAFDVIKNFPDIVGLFISTRPDCVDKQRLDLIETYSDRYEVWIEYGLQSIHDKTLDFINRKHSYEDFLKAVELTEKRNIKIAAHAILGLPGETKQDMIATAREISKLPLSGVKLHVFHILKGTKCEDLYAQGKLKLFELDDYVKACSDFLEELNSNFVILRLVSDAKEDLLVAPKWINGKQDVIRKIEAELKQRNSYQGKKYEK